MTKLWIILISAMLAVLIAFEAPSGRKLRIAIIPGHGGHDPGAVNPAAGLYEKDLNLLEAEFLAQRLERKGHEVLVCRDGDVFVSVYELQRVANDFMPDIVFVIHHNASPAHMESGWEVYYATEQSAALATLTAKALMLHLDIAPHYAPIKPASAEVFRRPYNCLKLLTSPAVLIEGAFIDHVLDVKWLEGGGWLQIVDALAMVVQAWEEDKWAI